MVPEYSVMEGVTYPPNLKRQPAGSKLMSDTRLNSATSGSAPPEGFLTANDSLNPQTVLDSKKRHYFNTTSPEFIDSNGEQLVGHGYAEIGPEHSDEAKKELIVSAIKDGVKDLKAKIRAEYGSDVEIDESRFRVDIQHGPHLSQKIIDEAIKEAAGSYERDRNASAASDRARSNFRSRNNRGR